VKIGGIINKGEELANESQEIQDWIFEHFQNGLVYIEDYPVLRHRKNY
jgi:hypothetical protein